MPDLVEWLTAILDEAERVALAAQEKARPPWTQQGGWVTHSGPEEWPGDPYLSRHGGLWDCEGQSHTHPLCMSTAVAAFVALHDPAAVLADITAKRALIAFLDPTGAPDGEGRYVAERALAVLASAYSHHDGYREEWKP